MKPFSLGRLVITPGALRVLTASGESPAYFLGRHASGDWGDCCEEDAELNDLALRDGSRIFSVYRSAGQKVYVITEACDEQGQRAATTILLPSEY